MRKMLLLTPMLLALPLTAQNAPPSKPGARDPSRVTAGSYKTDPAHTLVGWRVDHLGFNDYFGIFGDVTGTLTLDPKKLDQAKVDITIPVSKVTTPSARLTEHLLRAGKDGGAPDFFGPAPADARFVSTKVIVKGLTAQIAGQLTLNGVTQPVTLNARFTGAGKSPPYTGSKETVGFEASALIKRSAFNIKYIIPFVSDEVELDISVAFEKVS